MVNQATGTITVISIGGIAIGEMEAPADGSDYIVRYYTLSEEEHRAVWESGTDSEEAPE